MSQSSFNRVKPFSAINFRSLTLKTKPDRLKVMARSVMAKLDNLWKVSPKVCKNVRVWAETQPPTIAQTLYTKQVAPRTDRRSQPKTIEAATPQIFLDSLSRRPIGRYLTQISNAKVIGNEGIIILPDGLYTEEPAKHDFLLQGLPEYYSAVRHLFLKRRKVKGNYFSLMQMWSTTHNYYHTLRDNVNRLYDALEYLPDDVIFLVPQKLKAWQYEILATLGIGKDRLLNFPKFEIWTIESLYFTPHGPTLKMGTTEAFEWGRQRFYDHHAIEPTPQTQTELIYISRALTSWRRIVNEVEVERLLASYGFTTYLTEKMNIGQQVELFSKAKVVVSATGAALANLMFAQEGTHVLEISTQESDPVLGEYYCEATWATCEDMGHHYSFFHGEAVDRPGNIRQDMFICLEKLERSLQNILATLPERI